AQSWEEKSAKQGLSGEEVSQCQTIRELRLRLPQSQSRRLCRLTRRSLQHLRRRASWASFRFSPGRRRRRSEFRVATERKSSSRHSTPAKRLRHSIRLVSEGRKSKQNMSTKPVPWQTSSLSFAIWC